MLTGSVGAQVRSWLTSRVTVGGLAVVVVLAVAGLAGAGPWPLLIATAIAVVWIGSRQHSIELRLAEFEEERVAPADLVRAWSNHRRQYLLERAELKVAEVMRLAAISAKSGGDIAEHVDFAFLRRELRSIEELGGELEQLSAGGNASRSLRRVQSRRLQAIGDQLSAQGNMNQRIRRLDGLITETLELIYRQNQESTGGTD